MSLSRDSRSERKWKLWRRTEFRLKQGLERIDWEEDVLLPEIESLKAGKSVAGLPAGAAFDLVVDDEVPTATETSDASRDVDGKTKSAAKKSAAARARLRH